MHSIVACIAEVKKTHSPREVPYDLLLEVYFNSGKYFGGEGWSLVKPVGLALRDGWCSSTCMYYSYSTYMYYSYDACLYYSHTTCMYYSYSACMYDSHSTWMNYSYSTCMYHSYSTCMHYGYSTCTISCRTHIPCRWGGGSGTGGNIPFNYV